MSTKDEWQTGNRQRFQEILSVLPLVVEVLTIGVDLPLSKERKSFDIHQSTPSAHSNNGVCDPNVRFGGAGMSSRGVFCVQSED